MGKVKRAKIDPERWYGLLDIVTEGLFPWARNVKTVRKWVMLDKKGKNILKAKIVGEEKQLRYHIKGKNIVAFVANMENGAHI